MAIGQRDKREPSWLSVGLEVGVVTVEVNTRCGSACVHNARQVSADWTERAAEPENVL